MHQEAVLQDIDVLLFLQGKGKAGDPVVEDRTADPEGFLVQENAVRHRHSAFSLTGKPVPAAEAG